MSTEPSAPLTEPQTQPRPEAPTEPVPAPAAAEPAAATPTAATPTATEPAAPERAATEPAAATRHRNTRLWVILAAVLLIFLVIVAIGIVVAVTDDDGGDGADRGDHTVSAPIDGRTEAELNLVSGATAVTVRAEAMGGTLYRVSTPPAGDSVPQVVDRGDRIEVHLAPTGETGPSSVELVLSTEVTWTALRFTGGADDQVVDLTGATVGELDFPTGASRIQLTLPAPEGTVPVRMGGGAGEVALELPPQAPIQVALRGGAGLVVIDGERHAGVAAGTVFTPEDWAGAVDRYDLDASGLGQLTVTRTAV